MIEKLTVGSLFDGIAGFPLAASRYDIEPKWASEIEPFPISVSRRHFPKVVHAGDVTKINGAELEPVDVITFGSPCQDLSVAGKRAGLGFAARRFRIKSKSPNWMRQRTIDAYKWEFIRDRLVFKEIRTRSGLFKEAVRIIREMQEATKNGPAGPKPRFAVWENVPGAFSSNAGRDFAAVLESLVGGTVDVPRRGWTNAGVAFGPQGQVAWRVFDAQHWGVPQRRRRIYLVADFGGERAGQILFEPYSLSGNSQTGAEAGQGVAGSPADCSGTGGSTSGFGLSGNAEYREGRVSPLRAEGGDCGGVAKPSSSAQSDDGRSEGLAPQIDQCLMSGTGRRYDPETETLVPVATPIPPRGPWIAPTLNASASGMGQPRGAGAELDFYVPLAIDMQQVTSQANSPSSENLPATAFDVWHLRETENSSPLMAKSTPGGMSLNFQNPVRIGYIVRRLTPVECERLQGVPDGYTEWGINEKGERVNGSDTARYKALGNGLAIPPTEFVMRRIAKVLAT